MKSLFSFLLIAITTFSHSQGVGIGTNTPTEKLDVNGNINLTGALKTSGNAGSPGDVLTSTGTGLTWTSLGTQAGFKKCKVFMTSGDFSFTVPTGVSEVMVEAWGAGSGGAWYCGGTSGGYGRTVQTVSSGSTITLVIGKGSASSSTSTDGGNTTVTFSGGGNMIALGGGAVTGNLQFNSYTRGLARSGDGSVTNAFYMFGNPGEPNITTFEMTGQNSYRETTRMGQGGAPVGMLNSSPPQGSFVYRVDGNPMYAVLSNTTKTPGAGGPAGLNGETLAGGDGMVIIWYN